MTAPGTTRPSVAIVGYGMGNVTSLRNALEAVDADVSVAAAPEDLRSATHLVLPGVGSFRKGMENLRSTGFAEELVRLADDGRPLLGICLGLQLLATEGDEHGPTKGLDLIPGRVPRMDASTQRIPHMGWNDVTTTRGSRLFGPAGTTDCFYFVHSYHLLPDRGDDSVLLCDYGAPVVAAVEHENLMGVQFHPEKSHASGLRVLARFLET